MIIEFMDINQLTDIVIGVTIEVHKALVSPHHSA